MSSTQQGQVLQGNALFANSLYRILSRREGNVFFSPISIHAALSTILQGAHGETAAALSQTLNNPTAEGYKSVIGRLNSIAEAELLMANKIYGNIRQNKFLKDFERAIADSFGAEIELLDFKKPAAAAQAINGWVESKTKNKIKSIVDEQVCSQEVSLILINAIYFKGEWCSKFRESSTKPAKFYLDADNSIDVDMMYQKKIYMYKHDEQLGAQIVSMPYKGLDVEMMVILPSEKNKIKDLEAKLATTDLTKLADNLKRTDLLLSLPRFKMEETIKLNEILKEMGLKNIFDKERADFKGIMELDPHEYLYVSDVLQKAYIKVNESGTEAAAATRIRMLLGCAPGAPVPVPFIVDHPAIFMLVASHQDARSILFYGRLSRPES